MRPLRLHDDDDDGAETAPPQAGGLDRDAVMAGVAGLRAAAAGRGSGAAAAGSPAPSGGDAPMSPSSAGGGYDSPRSGGSVPLDEEAEAEKQRKCVARPLARSRPLAAARFPLASSCSLAHAS
jgi:hypothetical protein